MPPEQDPTPIEEPTPPSPGAPGAGDPPADLPPKGEDPTPPISDAPVRPDDLPDAFWNDTEGVLLPDLLSQFNTLTASQAERDVAAQGVPEAPDGYELPDNEALELPADSDFKFDDSNPLVPLAREFAHANGMTQEAFAGMAKLYVKGQKQELDAMQEASGVELAKLGDNSKGRVDAVVTALTSRIGSEKTAVLQGMMFTAAQVEAFESLVRGTRAPGHNAKSDAPGKGVENWAGMTTDEKLWTAHQNARKKQGQAA